jgi:hypothetical protein
MARRKMLGEINLLGLGAFTGKGLNPIWGTAIGGGSATVTTLVARHAGVRNPELVGFGVGAAASAAMFAMKSTRQAAVGGLIGAFLGAGVWYLEKVLLGAATVPVDPATSAAVAGIGYPQLRALNALNGLGIATMSNVPRTAGAIPGVAGSQLAAPGGGNPPVSLMGTQSAAAAHLLGIGGPPIHGLSASYGATLLGAGR